MQTDHTALANEIELVGPNKTCPKCQRKQPNANSFCGCGYVFLRTKAGAA